MDSLALKRMAQRRIVWKFYLDVSIIVIFHFILSAQMSRVPDICQTLLWAHEQINQKRDKQPSRQEVDIKAEGD